MAGLPDYRKSQGVQPYGVGAIVDFPDDSLMVAGLDVWPQESVERPPENRWDVIKATEIIDGRLQRRLSADLGRTIRRFHSPAEAPDLGTGYVQGPSDPTRAYMPFVRFPNWHFCPRCRTLQEVPWNTPSGDSRLRCSSDVRLHKGTAKNCSELTYSQKRSLVPVRFLVACPSGHIMDFPWQKWAHLGKDKTEKQRNCRTDEGRLFLYATGKAGLEGIQVKCSQCEARRTLANAFGGAEKSEPFRQIWTRCPGHRPWLGPDAPEADCPETPKTIQRGASNTYFSEVKNSILIPPYSQRVKQVLDDPDVWDEIKNYPTADGKLRRGELLMTKAKKIRERYGIDPEIFIQAADEKLNAQGAERGDVVTEQNYRHAEYLAFLGPRPPRPERTDFDLLPKEIGQYTGDFRKYFKNVVMVPKLRETRVLTAFTRLVPPSAARVKAELSLRPLSWLPAMEAKGEGIFLVLRSDAVERWLSASDEINQRVMMINRELAKVCARRGISERTITPEFLLTHTLAHVLIRQLTFDCGYDSSSLRERIYVSDSAETKMTGLLIYTASGDSEGTLGGLVRQGMPGRLERTFEAAISNVSSNARLCSSDPLCIESEGQGVDSLNLAACHACVLLPETACEEGNMLLDRALLIGTPGKDHLGFFSTPHR